MAEGSGSRPGTMAVSVCDSQCAGCGHQQVTGWADVATIIPWNMYLAYGDKKILENQYQQYESLGGKHQEKCKE